MARLVLERVDGQPVHFRPGQWVSVAVPVGAGELWRAYSIATAASPAAGIDILVSRIPVGLASEALHGVAVGARLRMSEPGGTFRLSDSVSASAAVIFAATGTGIAPYRSMIRAALAAPGGAVTLLHGVRAEEDLLYRDEWEELARREPRFRYFPTLSRGDAAWTGRRGYVGPHLIESLAEDRAGDQSGDIYLCGLRRMTDSVAEELRLLGWPRDRLHVERFD